VKLLNKELGIKPSKELLLLYDPLVIELSERTKSILEQKSPALKRTSNTYADVAELADALDSGTSAKAAHNSTKPLWLCGFICNTVSNSLL